MKQTMYDILDEASEIAQLYAELQEKAEDGMTDEEQAEVILAWFGQNQEAFKAKCDSYLAVIRQYQAMEKTAKDEAKRLQERAKSHAGHVTRLKDTLREAMTALGIDSVKTACNTVSLANPSSIAYDVDMEALPEAYQRVKVDADRTAIQKALKEGIEIKGVVKKESQKSLRIL